MAIRTFPRPYDYEPNVTKAVIEGEEHIIPATYPHDIYLHHIPRRENPSTVRIDGYIEVDGPPGPGQYRVHYIEENGMPLGRVEFHAADAGKTVAVSYHACGTVIWAEDRDGRPNVTAILDALDALASVRIVEKGSNANGEYVRWENGLQICYVRLTGIGPISGTWGSLYVFTGGVRWTFPASFVALPVVIAFGGSTSSRASIAYQEASTFNLTGIQLTLARGTSDPTNTDYVIAAVAIGAWK